MRRALPVAALALLAVSSMAAAQAPCDGRPARTVDLTVARHADATALEAVVTDLLGELGVPVCVGPRRRVARRAIVNPRPAAATRLARVWIHRVGGIAEVWIVDGPWERVLTRRVELRRRRFDAVAREEIGQIVYSAAEALLAGLRIGVARQEVELPREAPAETEPPPPRARAAVEIAGRYAVRLAGADLGAAHEIGLAGRVDARAPAPVSLVSGARLAARLPARYASEPVVVDAWELRVGVELGIRVHPADRAWFRVVAIGGAQIERVQPGQAAPGVIAAEASSLAAPWLGAEVAAGGRLAAGLQLSGGLELAVDLPRRRFVLTGGPDRVEVALAPAFQPALFLELSWTTAPGARTP